MMAEGRNNIGFKGGFSKGIRLHKLYSMADYLILLSQTAVLFSTLEKKAPSVTQPSGSDLELWGSGC